MLKPIVCTAALSFLGLSLFAQPIPERPEKLAFKPMTFQPPQAKELRTTLKNGVPVYILNDASGQPFVRINLMLRGGAYMDPQGKEGLAGLLGDQWREGGTEKLKADQLDEELEFLAARIQSQLGETSGELSLEILEKDFAKGLDLFMQVLTQPAFAQERLELAKKQAKQGMEQRNDSANSIANYQINYLINGEGHFTTRAMTQASVDAISVADLKAMHRDLMHPKNWVLAVSGKFDRKKVMDALNRSIGSLKALGKVSAPVEGPSFKRKPGFFLCEKDLPQSTVMLNIPGLRRTDADWFDAYMMNYILGGGSFTSRLFRKVRSDEGLTYGIPSFLDKGVHWKGNWSCRFQTKNTSAAYALRLVQAEIEKLKTEPVSESELNVAKNGIIDGFPDFFSNKQGVVNLYASEELNGYPQGFYANYREKIKAVTAEQIQRAAKKYLNLDELVVLVVGKTQDIQKGDEKQMGGLKSVTQLPITQIPLRDPLTLKVIAP